VLGRDDILEFRDVFEGYMGPVCQSCSLFSFFVCFVEICGHTFARSIVSRANLRRRSLRSIAVSEAPAGLSALV
jgi:hypothetical protein